MTLNKAVFALCLSLLLTCFSSASVAQSIQTYSAPGLLFKVDYPAEFHVVHEYGLGVVIGNAKRSGLIHKYAHPGEVEITFLMQSIPSLPPETRPVDMLPPYLDTENNLRELTIQNRAAFAVSIVDRGSEMWVAFVTEDNRLALVSMKTSRYGLDAAEPILMEMLESFRVIPPEDEISRIEAQPIPTYTGRVYDSDGLRFEYPPTWQARVTDSGTIVLEEGLARVPTPPDDIFVEISTRRAIGFDALLQNSAPFEVIDFYPTVVFTWAERSIMRANLQWGGPRTLIYFVEIGSGYYAEIRLRTASNSGDPLEYEPLILAIAESMEID